MAPPNTLVRLLLVWRRLTGGRLVIDAHSDSVLKGQTGSTRASFVRLAAKSDAVIVTNFDLAARLGRARTFILDDPPERRSVSAASPDGRPVVVFPASWAFDEPLEQVIGAAASLPDCEFVITGKSNEKFLLSQVPNNVTLSGYVPEADYTRLLSSANVILALTTRAETMQRAAYEALDHGVPILASDTTALRALLGDAARYCVNSVEAVVDGVHAVLLAQTDMRAAGARLQEHRFAHLDRDVEGLKRIIRQP